jgi:hypothetical protein
MSDTIDTPVLAPKAAKTSYNGPKLQSGDDVMYSDEGFSATVAQFDDKTGKATLIINSTVGITIQQDIEWAGDVNPVFLGRWRLRKEV